MSQPIETGAAVAIAFACIELVKSVVFRILTKNGNAQPSNGSARVLLEVSEARQLQKIADCTESMVAKGQSIETKFEKLHGRLHGRLDTIERKIENVVVCPLTAGEMDRLVGRLKGQK